jgi:hypothetical protein
MDAPLSTDAELQALVDAALRGELTEAQAERLAQCDPSLMKCILLAVAQRIAELQTKMKEAGGISPSTPSGQIPVYVKPTARKRKRKPGARNGHTGTRRPTPTRIDRRQNHRLAQCPECGGRLQRCRRTRTRIIEDIPEEVQPVVTEHTIHRDFCPRCKKHVEPVVPDALPGATIGHGLVSLTSWFHYGLGVTIDQIVQIQNYHLQTKLTPGGLVQAWHRLAEVLAGWYEQIGTEAKDSAYLHADETGWRVNGKTHWLWCFANPQVCYYMIDRSRGSPALQKFFTEAFGGTLLHDFWAAYRSVEVGDRQVCLVHLLRELEEVDLRNDSEAWKAFAKMLRRLVWDGIRLRRRADFTPKRYASRVQRLNRRICELIHEEYGDADAERLAKRLRSWGDHVFAFLDTPEIPWENNFAERQIRPAVIIRKNSLSNRSERGAATQAILMTVYRTLKMRGHNPMQVVVQALRTYVTTGTLPPLPPPVTADG